MSKQNEPSLLSSLARPLYFAVMGLALQWASQQSAKEEIEHRQMLDSLHFAKRLLPLYDKLGSDVAPIRDALSAVLDLNTKQTQRKLNDAHELAVAQTEAAVSIIGLVFYEYEPPSTAAASEINIQTQPTWQIADLCAGFIENFGFNEEAAARTIGYDIFNHIMGVRAVIGDHARTAVSTGERFKLEGKDALAMRGVLADNFRSAAQSHSTEQLCAAVVESAIVSRDADPVRFGCAVAVELERWAGVLYNCAACVHELGLQWDPEIHGQPSELPAVAAAAIRKRFPKPESSDA